MNMKINEIKISKEMKEKMERAADDLKKMEQEIAPFIVKNKKNIKDIKRENWQKSSVYLVDKIN